MPRIGKCPHVRKPDHEEEADLLRRCLAGEALAREELCHRYRPTALRMARRIAGEMGELEDLVQESFCRLLAHLRNLRGEASVTTWLYRTLTNLYRDKLRRASRIRECPLEEVLSSAQDPALVLESRSWRKPLARAVRNLSRLDRKVLWLRFRRGLSLAQIASILCCTVDAVKCRLYRITRYLRQELAFEI